MRRLAFYQATEADHRVVTAALARVLRRNWNLEGARHPDDDDVLRNGARRRKRRQRRRLEARGNRVVVRRHDEREAETLGPARALNRRHRFSTGGTSPPAPPALPALPGLP